MWLWHRYLQQCAFQKTSVKFLGHLISKDGVKADPEKTSAVRNTETPRSLQVKEEISQPTTLALYNPDAELKISADASSFGLGAVLFQREKDNWKNVAYASRTMSETDRRYAQIKKEALATT